MLRNFAVGLGALLLACASAAVSTAHAADLSGAGATFPAPVYAKWAEAYRKQTGIGLNYQAIGSGGGVRQIKAKTVDFGASDKPLPAAELNAAGLMQFPMVIGGVAPVVNVPGLQPGQLKLTGPLLADIFMGAIKKWNDPRIAAVNAGLKLPNLPITVVHRSDGSGTTFVFTTYLSMKSPAWKQKVGGNDAVEWPTGLGGKGNDGVAAFVRQTIGSIGYVEYAFAKQNKLVHVAMPSAKGQFLQPAAANFAAAAAGADWAKASGYYVLLLDQPAPTAWPISAATFILVQKNPSNPRSAAEVLKFFDWAYAKGDPMAQQLDYVPMPAGVKTIMRAAWAANVKAAGKPVYVSK
jgi:phosphate transport system substrate-binding protein